MALIPFFFWNILLAIPTFFQAHKMRERTHSFIAVEQLTFQYFYSLSQIFYLLANMWKATNMSIQPFIFVKRLNRYSPPNTRADNLPRQNARLRSNHCAALDENVIAEPNLAADDAIIFDGDAAADSGLRGNHHALSDVAVVSHMDHVVELRSFTNSRTTERATIDSRVRTQLDVVFDNDCANLRKLVVTHVAANITKAVGANDNSRVQNDSVADCHAVFNENIRMDNAVRADADVIADFSSSSNLRSITNRRILANANERADKDVAADLCLCGDY